MNKAPKAYKNIEFLNSREARPLRILAEYLEPEKRFKQYNIKNTIVFFGSARLSPEPREDRMNKYYIEAEELAFRLAKWGKELEDKDEGFYICSGGGPGIMEAANKGAIRAGSKSIGLNISLPFEQKPNDFISKELNFEFHYFFMRKLWFLYHAKAIIYFPGGFGTFDELFETLTLVQTGKYEKHDIPIILYGEGYWREILNFDVFLKYGLISKEDMDLINFVSNIDEVCDILKPRIEKLINQYGMEE